MIPEIGTFALGVALCLAVIQGTLPRGPMRKEGVDLNLHTHALYHMWIRWRHDTLI